MPRLKSEFRVKALLRRCATAGAFATIARKGDPDAGAIAVKAMASVASVRLYMHYTGEDGEPVWRDAFDGPRDDATVEERLARELSFDPDLWVIEIEDREGRAFLD